LLPDGERPAIRQRVLAWRFAYACAAERHAAEAVRRAAHFIRSHAQEFPAGMRAGSATAAAVLALKCYELFIDAGDRAGKDEDALAWIRLVTDAVQAFDAGQQTRTGMVGP
jgi:hypothetical protein